MNQAARPTPVNDEVHVYICCVCMYMYTYTCILNQAARPTTVNDEMCVCVCVCIRVCAYMTYNLKGWTWSDFMQPLYQSTFFRENLNRKH